MKATFLLSIPGPDRLVKLIAYMKLTLTYSGGLLEIIKPIRPLQNELSLNFAEILNTIGSWFLFGYY